LATFEETSSCWFMLKFVNSADHAPFDEADLQSRCCIAIVELMIDVYVLLLCRFRLLGHLVSMDSEMNRPSVQLLPCRMTEAVSNPFDISMMDSAYSMPQGI
jgi:hypothetical protein